MKIGIGLGLGLVLGRVLVRLRMTTSSLFLGNVDDAKESDPLVSLILHYPSP
jgi:hypothetical protein